MSKMTQDAKKDEFRKYLEKAGVLELLTKSLVSLYEEPDKPNDALGYLKNSVGGSPDDKQTIIKLTEENEKLKAREAELMEKCGALEARMKQMEEGASGETAAAPAAEEVAAAPAPAADPAPAEPQPAAAEPEEAPAAKPVEEAPAAEEASPEPMETEAAAPEAPAAEEQPAGSPAKETEAKAAETAAPAE